jgi:hypothetical protein
MVISSRYKHDLSAMTSKIITIAGLVVIAILAAARSNDRIFSVRLARPLCQA